MRATSPTCFSSSSPRSSSSLTTRAPSTPCRPGAWRAARRQRVSLCTKPAQRYGATHKLVDDAMNQGLTGQLVEDALHVDPELPSIRSVAHLRTPSAGHHKRGVDAQSCTSVLARCVPQRVHASTYLCQEVIVRALHGGKVVVELLPGHVEVARQRRKHLGGQTNSATSETPSHAWTRE